MPQNVIPDSSYAPTYHLLAFIDGLGFQEELRRNPYESRFQPFFAAVDSTREKLKVLSQERGVYGRIDTWTVGDSIILAIECPGNTFGEVAKAVDPAELHYYLATLTRVVAQLQCELIMLDIWTRGAISYERLHLSTNRIVGAAFFDAAQLESKTAMYLRVILDKKLVESCGYPTSQHVINDINSWKPRSAFDYQDQPSDGLQIVDPADFVTFVDYARCLPLSLSAANFFFRAAELISKNLRGNPKHYPKYRWSADYLLSVVESEYSEQKLENYNQIRSMLRGYVPS
jgi:hypothetical protein